MKIYLIVTQLIYLISLVPWFVILGLSFMSFDNGVNAYNIAFVSSISAYPLAVIVCSIISWFLREGKKRVAVIVNLFPVLWVIGFGLLMLFFV
ncbi:hypothetical protein [Pseudalkalibacillus caeni]|uniref:Uncharacterized protein n=1 Tax=Exobacillus caeni TaxID=2574798 RepID=A0A5R9F8E9_9BACL|nr:hypothetical protein [Pseudalkalibacillus caeni]TLS36005.1 hypothetical protein FCL54_17595 [Pseudalkalibacillus caeni]